MIGGGIPVKYCPFCGVGLQDEMKFCPTCGKEYQGAISEEKDRKTSADGEITEKSVSKENVAPKKKRDFRRLRIGGAIFLAFALVVGAWVLFKPSFSENASKIKKKSKSVVMIYCYDNFGNVRATGSGFVAYNDTLSCVQWCAHAKECVGEEMYEQMEKPEKRRFWRAILKEIRFGMDRTIDLYF